jgi:aminomethyltransferase
MVPFGGWDMPVEYSGLIAEHTAVRTAAGLFDVSHMGQFEVEGEGALAFLQRTTCNNVAKLVDGQAQYSALPMPTGCPVDDIIVYRRSERRYLVVVNAANIEKDWKWLLAQKPSGCGLHDLSDQFALLALQGPKAEAILQGLTPIDLKQVAFYRFVEGTVNGAQAIVARTGYTGEDGFEIFVAPGAASALWRRIVEAGRPHGLLPAGLGARDTLRLEAGLCLYGHDIDEATNPVEAGLAWTIPKRRRTEGGFPGAATILRQLAAGQLAEQPGRRRVGIRPDGRAPARDGTAILDPAGNPIGRITSGGFGPSLGAPIAMGYVDGAHAAPGSALALVVRDVPRPARVVPLPFVPNRYYRG